MTGTGQTVASHTTVVFFFISSLTIRSQTDDYVTRADIGIVDDIGTFHTASYRTVYNNRTNQVAYIGSFSTCGIYADTHFAKFSQQLICSVDDGRNHFSRYKQLVTADGRRY